MRLPSIPVVALAAALMLPLVSLPIFALGYWNKAEPLVVWFHATAALGALGIAISVWRSPATSLPRIAHPFVLLPLALGLYSVAAAPMTELPLLSLTGAPQSGFGALWFLDMAVYVACALLAAEHPGAWTLLKRGAMAIVFAVTVVKTWDALSLEHGGGHLLIFVAAYYGWLALALPLIVEPGRRRELVLAFGLAALVALASRSMTAIALLGGMGIAWAVPPRWNAALPARLAAAVVALAALLPWVLLHGLPLALEKESLRDRFLVHRLVQAAMADDPAILAFGHGWGRTQDAFHTWLNVSGETLWNPKWTFLLSDYFHSHNWGLESLHALGVPGLVLMLAGFVAIPVFAKPERRLHATAFAVAITLFHGLWFQLCLSLPLMAMALAATADRTNFRPPVKAAAISAGAIALMQIAASIALLVYGVALGDTRSAWMATLPRDAAIPSDFRGSDLAAAELIRDTLARGGEGLPVASMLAFIDQRVDRTPTILLLTTGLGAMAQIHVTGELAYAAAPGQMVTWRRWLDRLLVLAPGRSDQAIAYFTALIAQGRMEAASDFAGQLLAADSNDPIGQYYRGVAMLSAGSRPQGLELIRRSIQGGMDRFIPVDPQLRTLLDLPK